MFRVVELTNKLPVETIVADIHSSINAVLNVLDPHYTQWHKDQELNNKFRSLFTSDQAVYLDFLKSLPRIKSIVNFFANDLPQEVPALMTNQWLASSLPISNIVSNTIKGSDWFSGYPAHVDWHSVRGSKSTITAWLPVYYSQNNAALHCLGFAEKRSYLNKIQSARHGFHLDIQDNEFQDCICPVGNAVIFDGFTPHKTLLSHNNDNHVNDLRIAFSFRYELTDDTQFLRNGMKNNYVLGRGPDIQFSDEELRETGENYNSSRIIRG